MGQPFAGHQPGLYAGLQRFERPVRQRIFPFPRQSRRRSDENADREDQIRRQINEIHRDALGHIDVDYTAVSRAASGRKKHEDHSDAAIAAIGLTYIFYIGGQSL